MSLVLSDQSEAEYILIVDDPLIIEVHKSNGINFETALGPGNAFGLDEFNLAKGPGSGDKLLLTYNNDTKVIAYAVLSSWPCGRLYSSYIIALKRELNLFSHLTTSHTPDGGEFMTSKSVYQMASPKVTMQP